MSEKDDFALPLVSIIIRSMDRSTLTVALDSVACQTYKNIEVVVVNAKGSAHKDISEFCGHFPLRFIHSDLPLDRSKAANTGLKAAAGEYLIFLDDDDWFLPHHVVKLKAAFDNHQAIIAVYSAVQCVNESGEEISRYAEDFDPTQLRIENFIPIHAVLFRRRAFDDGARFDEALDVCEDWDFWLQLLEQGTFQFIPEVGACYSIRKGKGSGVRENGAHTRQVMTTIYKKWIPRWCDETLWAVLEYARHKHLLHARDIEIIKLNQIITERNQLIYDLLNSTSWRITKPVRMIRSLFKKNYRNL